MIERRWDIYVAVEKGGRRYEFGIQYWWLDAVLVTILAIGWLWIVTST